MVDSAVAFSQVCSHVPTSKKRFGNHISITTQAHGASPPAHPWQQQYPPLGFLVLNNRGIDSLRNGYLVNAEISFRGALREANDEFMSQTTTNHSITSSSNSRQEDSSGDNHLYRSPLSRQLSRTRLSQCNVKQQVSYDEDHHQRFHSSEPTRRASLLDHNPLLLYSFAFQFHYGDHNNHNETPQTMSEDLAEDEDEDAAETMMKNRCRMGRIVAALMYNLGLTYHLQAQSVGMRDNLSHRARLMYDMALEAIPHTTNSIWNRDTTAATTNPNAAAHYVPNLSAEEAGFQDFWMQDTQSQNVLLACYNNKAHIYYQVMDVPASNSCLNFVRYILSLGSTDDTTCEDVIMAETTTAFAAVAGGSSSALIEQDDDEDGQEEQKKNNEDREQRRVISFNAACCMGQENQPACAA